MDMKLFSLLTLAASIAIAGCNDSPNDSQTQQIKRQRLAREIASQHLKDPASAEFRSQNGFCGEVNSKNSFGGSAGFQRFIVVSKEIVIFERDSNTTASNFEQLWATACM